MFVVKYNEFMQIREHCYIKLEYFCYSFDV